MRKKDGTCILGWAENEERFPHLWRPPQQRGDQLGQRGSFRVSEESPATSLCQAGQSETYTDGLCHGTVHPSLRWVSARAHWGWVLELGVQAVNPGRGLLLAVRRRPEGTGGRSSISRSAHGGSPDHTEVKNNCWMMCRGAGPPLQPLSSCTSPCLHGHWGGAPTRASSWSPAITSSTTPHLPPGWPACPNHNLGSFLPGRLMYSGNLWSRLWWICKWKSKESWSS